MDVILKKERPSLGVRSFLTEFLLGYLTVMDRVDFSLISILSLLTAGIRCGTINFFGSCVWGRGEEKNNLGGWIASLCAVSIHITRS